VRTSRQLLAELEFNRQSWSCNILGTPGQTGPQISWAAFSGCCRLVGRAEPADRLSLLANALLILLDGCHRAGLAFADLQGYRLTKDPGRKSVLLAMGELEVNPPDFEHFSQAFCYLWHLALSWKIWRQDLIRAAAVALKRHQLEEINGLAKATA
jgi:hypothetical protein